MILYTIPLTTWLLQRWWHGESWSAIGFMNAAGVWWFAPLLRPKLSLALTILAKFDSFVVVKHMVPLYTRLTDGPTDFRPSGACDATLPDPPYGRPY